MKAIPRLVAAAAVTCLMLAACGHRGVAGEPVLCGTQSGTAPVFINITYGADGMPKASPDTCTVTAGTAISWRDTPGTVPFTLVFKRSNPGGANQPLRVPAQQVSGNYQVNIATATTSDGTYQYGITANGKTLDPAIIIRRAQ
ncbi:MAG TPA: hypothetical protein VIT90_01725 [Lysobacter sp.]